jgi:hypothetical protein
MGNLPAIESILESLAERAWSRTPSDPTSSFLLQPTEFDNKIISPQSLNKAANRIYVHARKWAAGLDIPYFVPPVRFLEMSSNAGHFVIDEQSYAHIAISAEFIKSREAILLILAHEACHHILFQSGLDQRHDFGLNERTTDLAMFICGFGELARCGHSIFIGSKSKVGAHIGYLTPQEYDRAFGLVLSMRRAFQLSGVEKVVSSHPKPRINNQRINIFKIIYKRLFSQDNSLRQQKQLLEKIIEKSEINRQ